MLGLTNLKFTLTVELAQKGHMGAKQEHSRMMESPVAPHSIDGPDNGGERGVTAMGGIANDLEQEQREANFGRISEGVSPPPQKKLNPLPSDSKPKPGKGHGGNERRKEEISPGRIARPLVQRTRGASRRTGLMIRTQERGRRGRVEVSQEKAARLRRLGTGARRPGRIRQTTPQLAVRQKQCDRRNFLAHA